MSVLESVSDRKREGLARSFLESKLNCRAINMPQFSPVDCLLIKDKLKVGVEFKFRNVDYNDYPTIWLEEAKQLALVECKAVWDKAYFMPCFNGTLYRIEVLETIGEKRETGGRYDRGIDDIDLMVAIPMDKLERVGKIW